MITSKKTVTLIVAVALVVGIVRIAGATHVSTDIDVPTFRPDVGGYLEFINPTEHPGVYPSGIPVPTTPPGLVLTEEHTGWTGAPAAGTIFGPDRVEVGDGDVTHGDRADFDWVQEHRSDESAVPPFSNHPNLTSGAMGWCSRTSAPLVPPIPNGGNVFCTPTESSPHVDPGSGAAHMHSVAEVPPGPLPELFNPDFDGFFPAVDVFSIISIGEDSDTDINGLFSPRDAALDYQVDFMNTATGVFSPGVAVIAWVPGWTAASGSDNWVARWVPTNGGVYNVVAIEPPFGFGHDEIVEIDAIKAVPEPSTVTLLLLGAAIVFGSRRKRR